MNTKRIAGYGKPSLQNLKFVIALTRADRRHERLVADLCRQHGLTLMQFAVLESLYHKGAMKIGEIIAAVLSTSGNMTVVVNNLVKRGLAVKSVCPDDSRAFLISITPAGNEKMDELFPSYLEVLDGLMEGLTTDEKNTLITLLKKLQQPTAQNLAHKKGEPHE